MILQALRTETADLHKQTEKHFYGKEILEGSLTKESYADMMQKNFMVFAATEELFARKFKEFFSTEGTYTPSVYRKQLLQEDLRNLGIEEVKLSVSVPQIKDACFLLGMIYVMEGSMLGGSLIAAKLRNTPALRGLQESRFYNADKEEIKRWRAFCKFISNLRFSPAQRASLLAGAEAFFRFHISIYKLKLEKTGA